MGREGREKGREKIDPIFLQRFSFFAFQFGRWLEKSVFLLLLLLLLSLGILCVVFPVPLSKKGTTVTMSFSVSPSPVVLLPPGENMQSGVREDQRWRQAAKEGNGSHPTCTCVHTRLRGYVFD